MSTPRSMVWIVWFISALFYAYQYILRVMPNVMMNDILQQFNIDAATFGQFSGVYYLGYSLMHLPIGIMLDRCGPRKVMPACILLTVVGLLPFFFTDFWIYPIIGRALIGVGSSAAILGTFKIIHLLFSPALFTRMLSFAVAIGLMGAIYGGAPVNYMSTVLGYKTVIAIFAVMGILLSIITYLVVPDIEMHKSESVIGDVKEVLSTPLVMGICCLTGLMVGPLEGFADVWGAQFLKSVYSMAGNVAASLTSMIFIGMCFGAPLLSLFAEKTKSPLGTIIIAGIVMAASFLALITGKVAVSTMSIMFIAVGICCAYQIIAIHQASTYVKGSLVGLTSAVANMIIMIFGYVFHAIIGLIVNAMGGPTSTLGMIYGVGIIPVALIIGIIGFTIIAMCRKQSAL